jgi:hypothetical protein
MLDCDWSSDVCSSDLFYRSIGAVPQDEWTVMRVSGEALEMLGGR